MISLLGEITTLLVISVLAGILIGWCIKSLLAGRSERIVRTHVARDVDEAMSDVESLRQKLHRKEDELSEVHQELQKMRGRESSRLPDSRSIETVQSSIPFETRVSARCKR